MKLYDHEIIFSTIFLTVKRIKNLTLVSLLAILISIIFTWPFFIKINSYYPDYGDYPFNGWILWYNQYAFLTGRIFSQNLYFQSNQFYPLPYTLAYSDHLFIPSLIFSPVFWITHNLILSVNIYVFSSFVLSFVSMYFVISYFTKSLFIRIIGAAIYTFNPLIYAHLNSGHIQLFGRYFLPLLFLYGYQYFRKPNYKRAFIFFLVFTLNSLTSMYFFIMTTTIFLVIAPLYIIPALFIKKKDYWQSLTKSLLIGLCFFSVILYFSYPYLEFSQKEGVERVLKDGLNYSASQLDWILSTPDSLVYGALTRNMEKYRLILDKIEGFNYAEHTLFLNTIPALLATFGVIFFVRRLWVNKLEIKEMHFFIFLFPLSIIIVFLMTPLGFQTGYETLAILHGIRAPSRFEFIFYVPFTILVTYSLIRIQKYIPANIRILFFVTICLFLYIENVHQRDYHEISPLLNEIAREPVYLQLIKQNNTFHFPAVFKNISENSRYLTLSSLTNEQMLNGYSGFFPEDWLTFTRTLNSNFDESAFKKLAALNIRYVIIHKELLDKYLLNSYNSHNSFYEMGKVFENNNLLVIDLNKYHFQITFCNLPEDFSIQKVFNNQEGLYKTDIKLDNSKDCYLPSAFANRYRTFKYNDSGKIYFPTAKFPLLISPFEEIIFPARFQNKSEKEETINPLP